MQAGEINKERGHQDESKTKGDDHEHVGAKLIVSQSLQGFKHLLAPRYFHGGSQRMVAVLSVHIWVSRPM